uniref:FERM domain-containing protein n=1 Tax=Caenorhabditis japonica TaxID=281687 RepID=A0A8R1IIL4_CAEJA
MRRTSITVRGQTLRPGVSPTNRRHRRGSATSRVLLSGSRSENHEKSRSSENRPILTLYFRVRVYIDQVGLLTCPKAREHYYLQLKDNFLDHWAGRHSVSEERCWYMAALALITDKGEGYL